MGPGIAGVRMAPAVAERVELLHIADGEAGLRLDPGPQPISKVAVGERIERPNGSPARGSPLPPSPATRMAGSSPSTATIAAVSPISIGVRVDSVMADHTAWRLD